MIESNIKRNCSLSNAQSNFHLFKSSAKSGKHFYFLAQNGNLFASIELQLIRTIDSVSVFKFKVLENLWFCQLHLKQKVHTQANVELRAFKDDSSIAGLRFAKNCFDCRPLFLALCIMTGCFSPFINSRN